MRVIMPVIIDRAGRNFNADETDGVSGSDNGRRGTQPERTAASPAARCSSRSRGALLEP